MIFNLVKISLSKKISRLSIIFMIIALAIICLIGIISADFFINKYDFLVNKEHLKKEYYLGMINLLEVIILVFTVLMSGLEIYDNAVRFASYFVTQYGKRKIYYVKLIAYFLLIMIFSFFAFLGATTIYIIRFEIIKDLKFWINNYLYYLLYFFFLFVIAFLIINILQNYFVMLISLVMAWTIKILSNNYIKVIKYFYPIIKIDYEKQKISFFFSPIYYIILLYLIIFFGEILYQKIDYKI